MQKRKPCYSMLQMVSGYDALTTYWTAYAAQHHPKNLLSDTSSALGPHKIPYITPHVQSKFDLKDTYRVTKACRLKTGT